MFHATARTPRLVSTTSKRVAALVLAAAVGGFPLITQGAAHAAIGGPSATTCTVWVSDTGSDAAAGTSTAPFKTFVQALKAAGAPLVVCIPRGATVTTGTGGLINRANTIVMSDPAGAGAAGRISGRLTLASPDTSVIGLDIQQGNADIGSSGLVRLWSDRQSLIANRIAAPMTSCVEVGYRDGFPSAAGENAAWKSTHDIRIDGNNIGPCTTSAAFLGSAAACTYSGLNGIYSQWVDGLDVTNNVIHDTPYRGVQVYPKNSNVRIANNLFRRNGLAVNIGTSGNANVVNTHAATNITVAANAFAEQISLQTAATYPTINACGKYLAANPPGVTIDDETDPTMGPVSAITIAGNCGTDVAPNPNDPIRFVWTNNVANTPVFASTTDDHQTAASPCRTTGPIALQPSAVSVAVTATGPVTATIGTLVRQTFVVTNPNATAVNLTANATMTTAGASPLPAAYRRLEGTGCVATTCQTVLAAGTSTTITAVYAAARGGLSLPTTLTVSAGGPSAAASITTAVTGSFCSVSGTAGADTLTAPTALDGAILCGFEGNDVLVPGRGGDVLNGGSGTDRISYTAALDSATDTKGWRIDLTKGQAIRLPDDGHNQDVLVQVESVTGSPNADAIIGSAGVDRFDGGNGNDSISGLAANDTLIGGAGNDTLNGGLGTDTCTQGLGSGTLTACEA